MDANLKKELSLAAAKIRLGAVTGVYSAKSGHPGGSLSIADILTYLYLKEMNVDAKSPKDEGRDRFVLSKGHTCPGLYATLAYKGFFSMDEMKNLRKPHAILQGHPNMKDCPGIDMSSGSLGQGFSVAAGMALSAKLSGNDYRTYCAIGDGELQEGQIWEAAMFAAHNNLDNLVAIVDSNGLQIDGNVDDVCSPAPIDKKFEAFGFNVVMIDGHDFDDIEKAFENAKTCKGKPTAIIAKTNKGRGVSYMLDNAAWHGAAPNDEQYEIAVSELTAVINSLEV